MGTTIHVHADNVRLRRGRDELASRVEELEQEVERLKGENIEFRGLLLKFKDHFKSLKPVFSRDSAVCWINSLINKGE